MVLTFVSCFPSRLSKLPSAQPSRLPRSFASSPSANLDSCASASPVRSLSRMIFFCLFASFFLFETDVTTDTEMERDVKIGKISKEQQTEQKVEILLALRKLGEQVRDRVSTALSISSITCMLVGRRLPQMRPSSSRHTAATPWTSSTRFQMLSV